MSSAAGPDRPIIESIIIPYDVIMVPGWGTTRPGCDEVGENTVKSNKSMGF